MGKYFGTDGVRGVANQGLTPELAYRLGRCGAYTLTQGKVRPTIVMGSDTRLSAGLLESALTAGILSIGADVVRLGVVPTPAVAFLTGHLQADAGVMISASHNPYPDNGIKFFGADGYKLSDQVEKEIEQRLDATEDQMPRPTGDQIGSIYDQQEEVQKYLDHIKNSVETDLCGIHVVVDGAHGAAYQLAPQLLRDLGADVTAIHVKPDGVNINVDSGSTHPERLQKEVVSQGAHLGLAFDGDADRLIAVDEKGNIIDGDHILYICGKYMQEQGMLNHDTIVTTVMSNLGFFKSLESLNIYTRQTSVGDRYVMEEMRTHGFNLGGEQSGHIIFLDHNTTGDGILTAVQLLRVLKEKGQTLYDLSQEMKTYPQLLRNVPVTDRFSWSENPAILQVIKEVENELGGEGRILVRPSGTESLVRVMAEGPDQEELQKLVDRVTDVIANELK